MASRNNMSCDRSFLNRSKSILTPNKVNRTPSRQALGKASCKTPKTPIHGMDRYIPNRNGMDLEMSHYVLTQANKSTQENDTVLREKLNNLENYRIMCYTDKAPVAPEGNDTNKNVVYSSTKQAASVSKANRLVPSAPIRILDAPDVKNDWYLNLIDWSSTDVLAVALAQCTYLWNATSGETKSLFQLPDTDYVSSLSWIQDGTHLAVGNNQNLVEIWDAETGTRLRKMAGHSQRVSALDWNAHLLTSGSKSGLIFHHDVRIPQHHVGTLNGHEGAEVCGLKWSPDGKYLASGANDNTVNVWDGSATENNSPSQRLGHAAAVKAIAWCPWKRHLLATGGGSMDRHLRIWNSLNANCLYDIDTRSQISAVMFHEDYQEIITGHGYQNHEINIWKFPSMTKTAELAGHTHRILSMCMNPKRSTVASLSADETLRFWECFQMETNGKKKAAASERKTAMNPIRMSLR